MHIYKRLSNNRYVMPLYDRDHTHGVARYTEGYNVCTLYNVHCTMYTVQCTLYNVHCTMYTVHPVPRGSVNPLNVLRARDCVSL